MEGVRAWRPQARPSGFPRRTVSLGAAGSICAAAAMRALDLGSVESGVGWAGSDALPAPPRVHEAVGHSRRLRLRTSAMRSTVQPFIASPSMDHSGELGEAGSLGGSPHALSHSWPVAPADSPATPPPPPPSNPKNGTPPADNSVDRQGRHWSDALPRKLEETFGDDVVMVGPTPASPPYPASPASPASPVSPASHPSPASRASPASPPFPASPASPASDPSPMVRSAAADLQHQQLLGTPLGRDVDASPYALCGLSDPCSPPEGQRPGAFFSFGGQSEYLEDNQGQNQELGGLPSEAADSTFIKTNDEECAFFTYRATCKYEALEKLGGLASEAADSTFTKSNDEECAFFQYGAPGKYKALEQSSPPDGASLDLGWHAPSADPHGLSDPCWPQPSACSDDGAQWLEDQRRQQEQQTGTAPSDEVTEKRPNRNRHAARKKRRQQQGDAAGLQPPTALQQHAPAQKHGGSRRRRPNRHRRPNTDCPEQQQQSLTTAAALDVLTEGVKAASCTEVQRVPGLQIMVTGQECVQEPGGNGREVRVGTIKAEELGGSGDGGVLRVALKAGPPVSQAHLEAGLQQGKELLRLLRQREAEARGCPCAGGRKRRGGDRRKKAAARAARDAFARWAESVLPAALLGDLPGDTEVRQALGVDGAARWLQGVVGWDMEVEVAKDGAVRFRLLTVSAWAEGGSMAAKVQQLADLVKAEKGRGEALAELLRRLLQVACFQGVLEDGALAWGDYKLQNLVLWWGPGGEEQLRMIDPDGVQRLPAAAAAMEQGQRCCAPVPEFHGATRPFKAPEMALDELDKSNGFVSKLRLMANDCPAVALLAGHVEAVLTARDAAWAEGPRQGGKPLDGGWLVEKEDLQLGELAACGGRKYVCIRSHSYIFGSFVREALQQAGLWLGAGREAGEEEAEEGTGAGAVLSWLQGLAERCMVLQPSQRPGAGQIRSYLCRLLQSVE